MKGNVSMFTVTIRKISSGHKLCAFQTDSLDHAYSIALTLMQSSNYSRCYCVATDWQGNELWNVQPQNTAPAPIPYPGPALQPAQPVYPQHQLPAYATPPQPAPRYNAHGYTPHQYPTTARATAEVIECELLPPVRR